MNSKSIKHGFSNSLLQNKTVLVTGAGKGIGRACTEALVHAGANVIAVSRTAEDLENLKAELGEPCTTWCMDVLDQEFESALEQQKDIDVLVNNVGANKPEPFLDIRQETYNRILEINFSSVFRATQKVVGHMIRQNRPGSIVNISSQMGHVGSPNRTLYCSTKHALEGFSKALAVELAEQNIRVNTVSPTFVETEMTRPMFEDKNFSEFVMSKIPMKRLASTEDVAAAVLYLASDLSGMVTGTSLLVDGGWVAH